MVTLDDIREVWVNCDGGEHNTHDFDARRKYRAEFDAVIAAVEDAAFLDGFNAGRDQG